jgi:hypothetical protein
MEERDMTSTPEEHPEQGLRAMAFCPVSADWLTERVSVEEAEALHMHEGHPFGSLNREWNYLKSTMQAGDELWNFSSSRESWEQLFGREGVAVVRDGKPMIGIVTLMN